MHEVKTKTYSVFDALKVSLNKKLSFAIYRLPGEEEITLLMQKDHNLMQLDDLTELPDDEGFLIAPFAADNGDKAYVIRPDFLFKNSLNSEEYQSINRLKVTSLNGMEKIAPPEVTRQEYIQQIRETIAEIKKGVYDKVVLSRVRIVQGEYYHELKRIFHMLCAAYPNAFVYLFRFKGQCWVGATPEPLVCTNENELNTVSLAATKAYSPKNTDLASWNAKEIKEQEYVTQYIENILSDYHITGYSKFGPYTKRAGRLLHLRTDFTLALNTVGRKLPALVSALHPTSAVCGMPMKESLQFIKQHEKHNREYYAGFLGPMGIDDKLQLFVNLRCMKVLDNKVALYIGGGITSDSRAEDEWEETEIKAETLLSILQQV